MSQLIFSLNKKSNQAYGFNVNDEGTLSIEVKWDGGANLSGFLFGPNNKLPYDKKTGSSPLTLSKQISKDMIMRNSMECFVLAHCISLMKVF